MKIQMTGGVCMLHQVKPTWIVATLALLILSLAVPAGARRPSRGGPGPQGFAGPGPEGRFAGGVLERLISPCRTSCLDTMRTCHNAAETTTLTCVQTTCPTEIEAAQSACDTDRTSQACQDAVSALRTCSDACLETFHSTVTTCRDTLGVCRDTCDTAQ